MPPISPRLKFHRKREINNRGQPSCDTKPTQDRPGYLLNPVRADRDFGRHLAFSDILSLRGKRPLQKAHNPVPK
jgi:hypothetical protein